MNSPSPESEPKLKLRFLLHQSDLPEGIDYTNPTSLRTLDEAIFAAYLIACAEEAKSLLVAASGSPEEIAAQADIIKNNRIKLQLATEILLPVNEAAIRSWIDNRLSDYLQPLRNLVYQLKRQYTRDQGCGTPRPGASA